MPLMNMKYLHLLCTLLFGVAVLLFFGLAYPHHLHYQEQYQLFLFDSSYVWETVRLPGGVADLLGRFCTQFFLFAWVGAAIIAVLLSAVQLLTFRLISHSRPLREGSKWEAKRQQAEPCADAGTALYGLSFVPSFLLWLFLLDENALLGGVWAVLLTLLAACGIGKMRDGRARRLLLVAAIPVLYWMVGPVCVALVAVPQTLKASPTIWLAGVVALVAVIPVLLMAYIPVPAGRLWTGIHYHRYPTVIPVLLWAAALSVLVIALIARVCHHYLLSRPQRLISGILCALSLVGGFCAIWKSSNFKAEKVMRYDFMARHQQWNRILETINAEKPNNQIGVTVQNLALAMHGLLASHLPEYNQNGLAGLLPDVERDATSPLPTAEAFYQLGMIAVAQRTVFEAQEAILDFQKSGRCYRRLAQTNLILGNYGVARKYLAALQKTLFYRGWANETLPLLGDEEAIARHPEYGRLRQWACKEDFYFSDHVTPEMLEALFFSNTDNHLAYQYLVAYYMLTGDRERYAKLLLTIDH